jgi:protocatechuate 3,4-dioxygenase beta subunit
MERKNFLRTLGATALSPFLPTSTAFAAQEKSLNLPPNICTLIPSETAGPFPLDLTENTAFFRKDIRETQTGVRLNVKLKIFGLGNCQPMRNVRVNIWHCSIGGIYSGYNNSMNPGDANAKHLRGYQFTDADGVVEFVTVFPAWYSGRIAHIHFQVRTSTTYAAVSQFTFPITEKNALYAANNAFYPKGADPIGFAQDNVFSDGVSSQLATLTPNTTTGGYDTYFEAAVQGTGTTGIGRIEIENAKQFTLGQNYPNPFAHDTTIPLTLHNASEVVIDLYDLQGKKVARAVNDHFLSGEHHIPINLKSLGLSNANYAYQLEVKNADGIFKDVKLMTALK